MAVWRCIRDRSTWIRCWPKAVRRVPHGADRARRRQARFLPRAVDAEHLLHGGEGLVGVGAKAIEADSLGQTALEHDFHRLRLDGGEEYLHVIAPEFLDRNVEGMHAARVHRRHVTHAEDDHTWSTSRTAQDHVELLGGSKEQWTFDSIKNDTFWNDLAADTVRTGGLVFILFGDKTNMGDVFHLAEEQDHRHDESRADPDGEIED